MTSKLLQTLGVLAILALVGGSIAALAVVKSRITITVASEEEAAKRGPDRLDLLAEDVKETRAALAAALDANAAQFRELAVAIETALAESDDAATADLTHLTKEVEGVRAAVFALEKRLERGQDREALAALAAAVEQLAARSNAKAEAGPLDVRAELDKAATRTAEAESAPAPVAEAAPASKAASRPRKGFLTFQVPESGFSLEKLWKFTVVESLSRVGFDAKSTLHDFSGATTKVRGEITACLARPAEGCAGSIAADAAALQTGHDGRDEEMRKTLDTVKHPEIQFDWASFDATSVDVKTEKVEGTARGTMTIRGVARPFAIPVRVSVDASRRVVIEGQTKVKLTDFQVPVPSQLGLISMEDEIVLWIALRARPAGAAASGGSVAK
jgi:polyisoprenoid-binding protein YceI